MYIVIRQLNELAQWSEKVFISYKYVVIANMLHIWFDMETVVTEFKAAILPVSPAAGIHTDNMPSNPTEKAKIPLRKKRKAYALSLTYLPIFFFKTKTSPVHHKLSTTWQASLAAWWSREEWNTACIYSSHWSSLFCHTNWNTKIQFK